MLPEQIPDHLSYEPVFVLDSSGKKHSGKAAIKRWDQKSAFWRGFKKSAKIVGVIILLALPFGFLEPFAFMVWGSILIGLTLLVLGPFLHMRFWAESVSFFYVEATCPYCQTKGKLNPYLSTAYTDEFTILCPHCGETMRAHRTSKKEKLQR